MRNKRDRTVVIGLLVLALLCQLGRWVIWRSASFRLMRISAHCAEVQQPIDEIKAIWIKAESKHKKAYLDSFLSKNPRILDFDQVKEAKDLIDLASKKKGNPRKWLSLALEAEGKLSGASSQIKAIRSFVNELDVAQNMYQVNVNLLQGEISQARFRIDSLQSEGYFSRHFTDCLTKLQTAEEKRENAYALNRASDPDYLASFNISSDGRGQVDEVIEEANHVDVLRKNNLERIASLAVAYDSVNRLSTRAQRAARTLDAYPAYSYYPSINTTSRSLVWLQNDFVSAKDDNSMSRQNFSQAATKLDQIEQILERAQEVFQRAIEANQKLQAALDGMVHARLNASSQISSAASQIGAYPHNSQSTAESYLRSARSDQDRAIDLEATDPIAAYHNYRQASSNASSAYNSVDTSEEEDDSSSSIGIGSSGSSVGSASSWSGSAGSGSTNSSGGGSRAGGSYNSGTAGGSFNSGSSGGSFGGGGL